MNKIIVAIFDSESAAAKGLDELRRLHKQGDISLYATSVFVKNADGKIEVKQAVDLGLANAGFGLLLGGLVGALAGSVGAVVLGASLGGLTGSLADLGENGINVRFADEVAQAMLPGKVAVLAEIDEGWTAPLDSAIRNAGGEIFRKNRADIADAQWASDLAAYRAELAALQERLAAAADDKKAALLTQIEAVKSKIVETRDGWENRLEQARTDIEAKIETAKAQLAQAHEENKAEIRARIAHLQDDLQARKDRLARAGEEVWDGMLASYHSELTSLENELKTAADGQKAALTARIDAVKNKISAVRDEWTRT